MAVELAECYLSGMKKDARQGVFFSDSSTKIVGLVVTYQWYYITKKASTQSESVEKNVPFKGALSMMHTFVLGHVSSLFSPLGACLGWYPIGIKEVDFMSKKLSLMFVGYFRDLDKDDLPKKSGVYLVYAGKPVSDKIVSLRKLFYIGESSNIHDRIVEHNRDKDWKDGLKEGELLYYAYALAPKDERLLEEAALIYYYKPPYNTEYVDNYPFERVELNLSGPGKSKTPFEMDSSIKVS